MSLEKHKEKLRKAVVSLFTNDRALINRQVNERTISARMAFYLTPEYPALNVDCEYNREGEEVKRLPAPEQTSTNDTTGKTIFPDIIVHKRGNHSHNEVIIEIKKTGNNDTARDVEKLTELTKNSGAYQYKYGFHVTFYNNKAEIRIYENGAEISGPEVLYKAD